MSYGEFPQVHLYSQQHYMEKGEKRDIPLGKLFKTIPVCEYNNKFLMEYTHSHTHTHVQIEVTA